ncbi:DNA cytosine methyltransferase [Ralstonia sp. CP]|uniref:DNA cytosine methyltransferase n=1 Tax=Ralstonia sp. CP TaxID=3231757 RepID=UPI00345B7DE0
MNELALFAGAGGGIFGGKLLGWRTVAAVEINAFCARRLMQRQNEGHLSPFPIWDDVRTFDGRPWRGLIDVVSAGFPCQDISSAGTGAGIDGERSGLWRQVARIAREVRPLFLWLENSPLLVGRGLAVVLGDIAKLGMHARWGVLGADDVGAPHIRKRMWILAYADPDGCEWPDLPLQPGRQDESRSFAGGRGEVAPYTSGIGLEGAIHLGDGQTAHEHGARRQAAGRIEPQGWQGNHPEPGILGVDDGLANWKHRIAATGNGQVPIVAATAWRMLSA